MSISQNSSSPYFQKVSYIFDHTTFFDQFRPLPVVSTISGIVESALNATGAVAVLPAVVALQIASLLPLTEAKHRRIVELKGESLLLLKKLVSNVFMGTFIYKQLTAKKHELATLSIQANSAAAERAALEEPLKDLSEVNRKLEESLTNLSEAKRKLEEELKQKSIPTTAASEIASLQTKLATSFKENESLKKEIATLKEQVRTFIDNNHTLETQLATVKEQQEKFVARQSMSPKLEQRLQIAGLEGRLEILYKENSRLQAELKQKSTPTTASSEINDSTKTAETPPQEEPAATLPETNSSPKSIPAATSSEIDGSTKTAEAPPQEETAAALV